MRVQMHSITPYWKKKNMFLFESLRTFRTCIRNAPHVDETREVARAHTSARMLSLNFHFRDVYRRNYAASLTRRVRKIENAFMPNKHIPKTITENRDKEYML